MGSEPSPRAGGRELSKIDPPELPFAANLDSPVSSNHVDAASLLIGREVSKLSNRGKLVCDGAVGPRQGANTELVRWSIPFRRPRYCL